MAPKINFVGDKIEVNGKVVIKNSNSTIKINEFVERCEWRGEDVYFDGEFLATKDEMIAMVTDALSANPEGCIEALNKHMNDEAEMN